jgi:dipeptidyl aminopeptidase/acylaminoacyl peptidase
LGDFGVRSFLTILIAAGWLTGAGSATAAPLEAYGKLPSIEDVNVSPDGSRIAASTTFGDKRRVVVIRLSDNAVIAGLDVGDTKLRNVEWADDDHLLITMSSTAEVQDVSGPRREYYQLLVYDLPNRKQYNPLAKAEMGMNVIVGQPMVRRVDGKTWLYNQGIRFVANYGNNSLYRTDLSTGVTRLFEEGERGVRDWLVDAAGQPLAKALYDERTAKWTLKVHQDGRWTDVQSTKAPIERPSLEGLARDGKSIVLRNETEQRTALEELSIATEPSIKTIGGGFERLLYDPRSHALVGAVMLQKDTLKYVFFEQQGADAWVAITDAYPDSAPSIASWSDDRQKIALRLSTPGKPPRFVLVDLVTGKAQAIGSVYDGIADSDVSPVQPFQYKASDGLEIAGYLTLPKGGKSKGLPLVVLPHGGPASRDVLGFDWLAQALASRGYAVLQPNFRGSDGYGWAFMAAGFGEWGGKMQSDLSDGVKRLVADGVVDPARVCIAGASYGGYAALAGAAFEPSVYRCAASIAGPSDLKRFLQYTVTAAGSSSSSALRYWDRFMGVAGHSDPRLEKISPALHAENIKTPVLLIHGRDDTVVPFNQSQVMADAMKKAGRPASLITLKGEDHWMSRSETRMEMITALVAFLEQHNPPH